MSTNDRELDNIVGEPSVIFLFLIAGFYLARKENRMRIYRLLGLVDKSIDICKERLECESFKPKIIWENVVIVGMAHLFAIVAIYLVIYIAKWKTLAWALLCGLGQQYSLGPGAHMLYSHWSYKAGSFYQIMIVILHTMSVNNSIIHWARDHRVHHKFTDTDADHINRQRGMFFAHIGWLLVEKHPNVIKAGRKLDISDLTNNPFLAFQRKYLPILYIIFAFLIPFGVPYLLWGERYFTAVYTCIFLPWVINMQFIGFANSWFHNLSSARWQPYTTKTSATDGSCLRHLFTLGGGNHNFHHVFPKDYSGSEFDSPLLFTKHIVNMFHRLGLVYDLRRADPELVKKRRLKIYSNAQDDINYTY